MGRLIGGPVSRQFLTSFAAGLTAIGIVNLLHWLRAPALGEAGTSSAAAANAPASSRTSGTSSASAGDDR